jgi:hypothetical protein
MGGKFQRGWAERSHHEIFVPECFFSTIKPSDLQKTLAWARRNGKILTGKMIDRRMLYG